MEGDQKSSLHSDKGGGGNRNSKIDSKMITESRYNPHDPEQQFYRENTVLEKQGMLLSKVGWRIADLSRDEQDLGLQCMAILSSQLLFPITVSTRRLHGETREQSTGLWMQVAINTSGESKDFLFLNKNTPQAKIFHFCQQKLLPILKDFFKSRLAFGQQLVLSNAEVLELFRSRVVANANLIMEQMGLLRKE